MSDLADLFPGFASHWIDTSVGKIFARSGGSGPPLLCLHGYPQTNVMWHQVAPELARHYTLIIPDLPGYGRSDAPESKPDHAPYTKRAMAAVMIEVMEALGHARFDLAGHDRGGRVAYRLALDHPGRLNRLATLDIVPTLVMWEAMNAKLAMRAWHWTFLAQPAPLPELMLGKAANEYFDLLAEKWLAGNAKAFDARAIAHYRASFTDPPRIHASCEDYRAGQNDRRYIRQGRSRCRPKDHRTHAGPVGRERITPRSRSARGLAQLGDRRAWNRHRLRSFPVRGSARRHCPGADRFLHRIS